MKKIDVHLRLEERNQIETLFNQGMPLRQIAIKLNRSNFCIQTELKRYPRRPYNAVEAHKEYEIRWKERSAKLCIAFSEVQTSIIKKMMKMNASKKAIRLAIGGCHYDRLQRWFDENEPEYLGGPTGDLAMRVSNLEQQMEILIEMIREKNGKNH